MPGQDEVVKKPARVAKAVNHVDGDFRAVSRFLPADRRVLCGRSTAVTHVQSERRHRRSHTVQGSLRRKSVVLGRGVIFVLRGERYRVAEEVACGGRR